LDFHRLKNSARSRIARLVFERRLDVRTSGRIELDELGVAGQDRWRYEPAEWRVLPRIVRRREIGPDDVFLDLGSGMGRVVLQAAQYGPRRVIGVELAEELTEIARENVERNRHRLACRDVELDTADALEYQLPNDVTIVFFNNPFTGEVFRQVMDKLVASLDLDPRRMRIIYRNPREHEAVIATGRFQLKRKWQRGAWRRRPRGVAIHLYESIEPA
jgi:16S rRNA G966 N2-methylase RsmD